MYTYKLVLDTQYMVDPRYHGKISHIKYKSCSYVNSCSSNIFIPAALFKNKVPGTDPSPRYLAALLKVVRAKGVKVLFTEPSSNPRLAKRLADDLGIAVAELDVLETGALTPTSYEDGMRRNLAVLRQALK